MTDKEKARIILDIIDVETNFNWNENDDLWISAIIKGLEEVKREEEK